MQTFVVHLPQRPQTVVVPRRRRVRRVASLGVAVLLESQSGDRGGGRQSVVGPNLVRQVAILESFVVIDRRRDNVVATGDAASVHRFTEALVILSRCSWRLIGGDCGRGGGGGGCGGRQRDGRLLFPLLGFLSHVRSPVVLDLVIRATGELARDPRPPEIQQKQSIIIYLFPRLA